MGRFRESLPTIAVSLNRCLSAFPQLCMWEGGGGGGEGGGGGGGGREGTPPSRSVTACTCIPTNAMDRCMIALAK